MSAFRLSGFGVAATLMSGSASAQELSPGYLDPGPVLQAAADAIGVTNLRCVAISGSAYAGMVGQQRLNRSSLLKDHVLAQCHNVRIDPMPTVRCFQARRLGGGPS